jgi:hypothetical protein
MDVTYSREEWDGALEAAEIAEWDSIDAGEQHGPLAQWICDQVIDHDKVERDDQRIEAAFAVLTERGETEFSPERLIDVIKSFRGETVDNWRTLAEEYADENGYKIAFIGSGEPTEHDYHQWYMNHGVAEGEVYAPTSAGGTLYWFDSNQW